MRAGAAVAGRSNTGGNDSTYFTLERLGGPEPVEHAPSLAGAPMVERGVSPRKWDAVRELALGLPSAEEHFPWGEPVIKVRSKPGVPPWRRDGEGVCGPMFLWLGQRDSDTHAITVNITESYEQAVALAHAVPTTISGLARAVGMAHCPPPDHRCRSPLCDWVDESYRAKAPRRLVAELDTLRRTDLPQKRAGKRVVDLGDGGQEVQMSAALRRQRQRWDVG